MRTYNSNSFIECLGITYSVLITYHMLQTLRSLHNADVAPKPDKIPLINFGNFLRHHTAVIV